MKVSPSFLFYVSTNFAIFSERSKYIGFTAWKLCLNQTLHGWTERSGASQVGRFARIPTACTFQKINRIISLIRLIFLTPFSMWTCDLAQIGKSNTSKIRNSWIERCLIWSRVRVCLCSKKCRRWKRDLMFRLSEVKGPHSLRSANIQTVKTGIKMKGRKMPNIIQESLKERRSSYLLEEKLNQKKETYKFYQQNVGQTALLKLQEMTKSLLFGFPRKRNWPWRLRECPVMLTMLFSN